MEEVNYKRIIHVCSIKNHPVMGLPLLLRERYVDGLSSIMAEVGGNDAYLRMICSVWCESIVGHPYVSFQKNPDKVKKALSIQRIKLRFFRMSYMLMFDSYYLVETWDYNKIGRLNILLREKYCKLFLKKSHQTIHQYYTQNIGNNRIPNILMEHRRQNLRFENEPMKRVLVVANISSGKSTLINALVGKNVCKSANMACTDKLRYIYNKNNTDGFSIVNIKDRTIDYHSDYDKDRILEANHVAFHYNSTLSDTCICFIDTPGANNCEIQTHRDITLQAIKSNNYDILLFVSNSRYYGTTDDKRLLDIIAKNCQKPILFVLNQLDVFKQKEDSIERMISYFRFDLQKIGIRNFYICPVSATAAFLLKHAEEVMDEDDKDERRRIEKKFSLSYYDLPFYVTNKRSSNCLESTGINNLEEIIKKI